jgi:hypothetical protein
MECSSTSTKSSLHRRVRNNGQGLGFKGLRVFGFFLFTYQNQVGGPGWSLSKSSKSRREK